MPKVFVKATFDDICFQCQRCGACCHHKRPLEFDDLIHKDLLKEFWERSNLIYLTKKDIHDISHRSGRKPEEFVDTLYKYDGDLVKVDDSGKKVILDLPVLKSREDTTCVFYEKGCSVYAVRPRACRLFPFRVEEETTPEGDILLLIRYNPSCPGIGKGRSVDKKKLEKLVSDQFIERSQSILTEIQRLLAQGKIEKNARIYRTLPGRRSEQG